MTWLIIQLWLWCLLGFVVGAVLAWLLARTLYRPLGEISEEFFADAKEQVA